jgi:ubiquinone/menaquinone biosynthesis C-methylase UbiE
MLTAESTAKGCHAYYLKEIAETPVHKQMRNLVRNYRRGIVFASLLKKKGYHPEKILEFGPGSGYFSAGVRYIFTDCAITVADIVDDVLKRNREVHGYEAIKGSPEDIQLFEGKRFDLIIARDILEHVTDIGKVAGNIASLLKQGGLLHFITPNGKDDVWGHFLNWKFRKTPSELLINHVNYFDGAGLLKCLNDAGFVKKEYFTYQIKYRLRGKGWKKSIKLAGMKSTKRSADEFITAGIKDEAMPFIQKEKILNSFIFRIKQKWLFVLYCRFKHHWMIHLNPVRNIGHEIHGVFVKSADNQ